MGEYASLIGDDVLRHRTRVAEHTARIESELASKVKSEFISNMSHELRTPLNTVIGFSKLLSEHDRRKLPDYDIVQYALLIHDAAEHLLSAINDILDMSKIHSGEYTLDAHEVDLGEVLGACLASARLASEEAGVAISEHFDLDLPPVRGDGPKLKQAFSNLISNAIKFTRHGGNVTVEARRHEDTVAVAVRDTGIGMTAEEIRIALTPFAQVDGGKSRWREGTGLGLPIAKSLVELHGGTLAIKSVKGKGTEAIVTLPSHQLTIPHGRDALFGCGLDA